MTTPNEQRELAYDIVDALLRDLNGRQGIGLDRIDAETWNEMRGELATVVEARLESAPPQAREAWQPIETAPDDAIPNESCGTLVTVWGPTVGYSQLYGFVARDSKEFTHWCHLPPPPTQREVRSS